MADSGGYNQAQYRQAAGIYAEYKGEFAAVCGTVRRGRTAGERGGADSDDSLLKRIILYINAHYTEKLTLCAVAHEFKMSPKHFCRFFKKNFRCMFVEYVNTIRLERAR